MAGKGRSECILKPQSISPALQKFVGTFDISRSDAVKKIWSPSKPIIFKFTFHFLFMLLMIENKPLNVDSIVLWSGPFCGNVTWMLLRIKGMKMESLLK